jgi:predicted nucleotidyltransferase
MAATESFRGCPWCSVQQDVFEPGIADRATQAIARALGDRLVAVVLFGSRARGKANEESDWDLLVVAQDLPRSPLERLISLKQPLPAGCEAVSLLARTPEEFEGHVSSLHLDIALDGRILYDPNGYMGRHLSRLRWVIEEAGLFRESTEAGDEWRWAKEPTGSWNLRHDA